MTPQMHQRKSASRWSEFEARQKHGFYRNWIFLTWGKKLKVNYAGVYLDIKTNFLRQKLTEVLYFTNEQSIYLVMKAATYALRAYQGNLRHWWLLGKKNGFVL